MYQNLVSAGTYKGKLYGITPGINGMALFYNKDMFSAAGLKPPTTWAEIRADAKALTKAGVYGMAFAAYLTAVLAAMVLVGQRVWSLDLVAALKTRE